MSLITRNNYTIAREGIREWVLKNVNSDSRVAELSSFVVCIACATEIVKKCFGS